VSGIMIACTKCFWFGSNCQHEMASATTEGCSEG